MISHGRQHIPGVISDRSATQIHCTCMVKMALLTVKLLVYSSHLLHCSVPQHRSSEAGERLKELITYTQNSIRFCSSSILGIGYTSVNFLTYGVPFTQVCGRALGYQYGHTDAFRTVNSSNDSYYVEGLSVTHSIPKNHIWTFASWLSKQHKYDGNCPRSHFCGRHAPSFVLCRWRLLLRIRESVVYWWPILWDPQGCTSGAHGHIYNFRQFYFVHNWS